MTRLYIKSNIIEGHIVLKKRNDIVVDIGLIMIRHL
jgi:hypothetical protein